MNSPAGEIDRVQPIEFPTKARGVESVPIGATLACKGGLLIESEMSMVFKSRQSSDKAVPTEVPWSDSLTTYDREHFTTYMQFLDFGADNATYEEMALEILGIDPELEPERARKAARSHLDRANWMMTTGYKELFAS